MASWQHQLLSRVIRTGNLNEILEWGITQSDFTQSETLNLFQILQTVATGRDGAHFHRNRRDPGPGLE